MPKIQIQYRFIIKDYGLTHWADLGTYESIEAAYNVVTSQLKKYPKIEIKIFLKNN